MNLKNYVVFLVFLVFLKGILSKKLKFRDSSRSSPENDWISKVHMVFMNHLDVGYADFINNILNKYFQVYFERAAQISISLRKSGYIENMVYTTHPWLVSLFLDCPPNLILSGIKLKCPNQQQRDNFLEAVRRGDITWHAGSMNLQTEFMTPWLFEVSLGLSSLLDKKFNITRKAKVVSQRDVPGLTQASIPSFVKKGISALTVGVNGGTPPPVVPKLFRWKYGDDVIVTTFHPGGYPNDPGSIPSNPEGLSRDDCIFIEGFPEALCFVFRTDNAGPPETLQEVLNAYEILRAEFPQAELVSGNLEDFFAAIDQIKDQLPIISNEIGDIWIQGIASDPKKNAQYMFISNKLWECINSGVCSLEDRRIWNATRFLIKLPEHTWGLNSEHDTANWNNPSFEPIRKVRQNFINSANSWWEQRNFTDLAMEALENHVIAQEIKDDITVLDPQIPDLKGFVKVSDRKFTCPLADIKLLQFGNDGSISRLIYANTELADELHKFGTFVYQTFNETDFVEFSKLYDYSTWSAGFYKPNCTASAHPESRVWPALLEEMYINKFSECDFWLKVVMADLKTVSWYGAPSQIWIRYSSRSASYKPGMDVVLQWFNKTITRLPESILFAFKPIVKAKHRWTIHKMSLPVDLYNVLLNGSQYNHVASLEGVEYRDDKCTVTFRSLDVPVVNILVNNELSHTFPAPLSPIFPSNITGIAFNAYNNIWETNYIMWYPYIDDDKNFKVRFGLDFSASKKENN